MSLGVRGLGGAAGAGAARPEALSELLRAGQSQLQGGGLL